MLIGGEELSWKIIIMKLKSVNYWQKITQCDE
jgi:hypothetical protein